MRTPQEDLLIIEALVKYAHDRWETNPHQIDYARELAREIAATYNLGLTDALRQRAEVE